MVPYYGDFAEDDTVNIPFNTFTSDDPSASCTITDLADADIKVHKDGSTDEIATDGATVAINFDGVTGNHLITIDTSVHADYATGSEYQVRIEGTTVDGATINAWVGAFSIERAGGTIALLKLIQAAVITNAAGTDIAADIIAVKAETALIVADTNELQTDDIPGTLSTNDTSVDTQLAAIKAETALIVADTNELQTDDIPGTLSTNDTSLDTQLAAIKAETALIVTDTNELQTDNIPGTLATIAGYLDTEIAAILADTGELQTDWANGGRLDLLIDAIKAQTDLVTAARMGALTDWINGGRLDLLLDAIPTTAMRGTDNAATEAKQDIIDTVVDAIKVVTDALTAAAATKLALSAGTIVAGTVSWDNTNATTTVFYSDDITEATADHFNGRIVIFTSGALQYQATDITDYELDTGEGKFTVTALTEAPADNVTFIII